MKKRLLILPLLAGFALSSCSVEDLMFWQKKEEQQSQQDDKKQDEKVVTSVKINGSKSTMTIGEELKLTATVTTSEGLSTEVDWSSSNTSVATVTAGGKVTAKTEGTVTITAKSKADSTKSDSVSITVVYNGLHPELIQSGYTYTRTFPSAQVNTFTGATAASITTTEGFYFKTIPAQEATLLTPAVAEHLQVLFEYSEANSDAVYDAFGEMKYFFDSSEYSLCFIDPTQTYEADFSSYQLSETSYIFGLDFYRVSDKWKSSTNTEDTEWNEATAKVLAQIPVDLPFVKLGTNYDIYTYSSGTVEISDYCADYTKLDGYGAVLKENGFEEVVDEETKSVYYTKNVTPYAYVEVYFGFNKYGNSIDIDRYLLKLDNYPGDEVAAFVGEGEGTIGSKYSVPAFSKEGYKYTFDSYQVAVDEKQTDIRDAIEVGVYGATENECMAYVNSLVADEGYTLDETVEHYYGSTMAFLHKGKICICASINYVSRDATALEISELLAITEEQVDEMTDEEYEEYSDKMSEYEYYGTFTVYEYEEVESATIVVYGDPEGIEEAGLYIRPTSATIDLEETYTITPIFFEIDKSEVTYVSSDPTIATVDENGVVSSVAYGEAVITASIHHPELGDLEATLSLLVKHRVTMADVAAQINELLASLDIEDTIVLPEMDGFEFVELDTDDFEDEGTAILVCETTETEESYCAKLKPLGYEITEDEWGYPIASNGVFEIEPSYDSFFTGYFYLYITYGSEGQAEAEEFTDSVTFSELGYKNTDDVESVDLDHVAVEFDVGTGSANPKYYDTGTGVRVYAGNTITVSVDGELDSIVFTMTQNNKNMTPSVGSYDQATKTWTPGEEEVSSVTFTVESGSGHNRISGMTVTGYGYPNQGGGGGGGDVDPDLAAGVKAAMEVIATAYYDCDASELSYGDYENEDDYYSADVLIGGGTGFAFAEIWDTTQEKDADTLIDTLVSFVPSGATKNTTLTEEEDGYHDVWFNYGDYLIGVYAQDKTSDTYGNYVYFSIDVVNADGYEAYYDYMYLEE